MSGTVDVRSRRRERTRREILDAAWRLAERDGITGLSLRDLAAEVGMRAPSLYTYFASKGAIYDAMFATGYRELDAAYADVATGGDRAQALIAGLERFLRFCQASVPRYQLMFTRIVPDWTPSPEAYAASEASYDGMTRILGAAGISAPRAVDLYTAIASGLAAQQIANDLGGDRWVRLVPDAVEMFIAHLDRSAT